MQSSIKTCQSHICSDSNKSITNGTHKWANPKKTSRTSTIKSSKNTYDSPLKRGSNLICRSWNLLNKFMYMLTQKPLIFLKSEMMWLKILIPNCLLNLKRMYTFKWLLNCIFRRELFLAKKTTLSSSTLSLLKNKMKK